MSCYDSFLTKYALSDENLGVALSFSIYTKILCALDSFLRRIWQLLLLLAGSNSFLCMPSKLCFDLHKNQSFTLENSVLSSTFSLSKSAFHSLLFRVQSKGTGLWSNDCVSLHNILQQTQSMFHFEQGGYFNNVKNW